MEDCPRFLRWQHYSYFKLGKWKEREKFLRWKEKSSYSKLGKWKEREKFLRWQLYSYSKLGKWKEREKE
jgi:hypothetical protein